MRGKAVRALAAAAILVAGSTLSAPAAQHQGGPHHHGPNGDGAHGMASDKAAALKYSREHPEIITTALRALPSLQRQKIIASVAPEMSKNRSPQAGEGGTKSVSGQSESYGGAYAMAIDKAGLATLKYLGKHPEIITTAIGLLPFAKRKEIVAIVMPPQN